MAVLPEALETPERDMALLTRGPGDNDEEATPDDFDARGAADELQALRARIEAARSIQPAPKDLHCRDCFQRGRDAALRVIEEE
jgi:hypothetical protein